MAFSMEWRGTTWMGVYCCLPGRWRTGVPTAAGQYGLVLEAWRMVKSTKGEVVHKHFSYVYNVFYQQSNVWESLSWWQDSVAVSTSRRE
jgi:hypothetical protein